MDDEARTIRLPRKGIQSIEIGARLIDALIDARRPLRLKQIADQASLTPSKARMYLVSLIRTGLIEQDERTGLYAPGPTAIRLGVLALGQNRMLGSARALIEALSRETGNLVLLTAWDGAAPLVVASSESSEALPIAFKVGSEVPLWTSATGNMLLAHLPEPVVERLFERCPAGEAKAARRDIAAARTQGYLHVDPVRLSLEASIHGYAALAAPILNRAGGLEFVVTMLVLSGAGAPDPAAAARLLLARIARFAEDQEGLASG